MEIVYLDDVEFDLRQGRHFYDFQQKGIGDYFVDSMLSDADSLALHAGTHSQRFGYFRMLGSTFPFAIYYLLEKEIVTVYAILDIRQDPTWVRAELTERSETK